MEKQANRAKLGFRVFFGSTTTQLCYKLNKQELRPLKVTSYFSLVPNP